MRRLILTGLLSFALAAGLHGIAAADETLAAAETAPAAAEPAATAARALESAPVTAAEVAEPTAGADLVMWNAAPPAAGRATADKRLSPVRRFASGIVARSSAIATNLTRSAMRFIGTPYAFGGTSAGGFDCSGYVQHVFAMLGVHLPRTADAQYDAGKRISGSGMHAGDLVFFHTYASGVSHVGIYLGNDKFIHSSSSRGVMVSRLHDSYWSARYLGAKRVGAVN